MKNTLGLAAVLAGAAGLSEASLLPISGTGWTNDVIMESGASYPVGNFGVDINSSVAGWAFYESGYGVGGTQGLNSTGAYTGPSGASYQMEAYNANNVFQNGGTFTLDSPGQYSDLAFLVTHQASSGGITWTATLNFSDTSSTVLGGWGVDWIQSATQVVVSNHGLYQWLPSSNFYDGALSMVERTFTLSAADQLKNLESIDFALTGGDNAVFHAISGQAVPEASAAAIFILGGLGIATHRRRPRNIA